MLWSVKLLCAKKPEHFFFNPPSLPSFLSYFLRRAVEHRDSLRQPRMYRCFETFNAHLELPIFLCSFRNELIASIAEKKEKRFSRGFCIFVFNAKSIFQGQTFQVWKVNYRRISEWLFRRRNFYENKVRKKTTAKNVGKKYSTKILP